MKDTTVIVSSDDGEKFINFWPIVCKSYQKFFNITPILALVTNEQTLVDKCSKYGEVHRFEKNKDFPAANQAKLARFHLASTLKSVRCMIEDIDTIPLQVDFIERILDKVDDNKINSVGHEVYEGGTSAGQFPVSNVTATGDLFKELLNPADLQFTVWLKHLSTMSRVGSRENPKTIPTIFSDEGMIRMLIKNQNFTNINKIKRDCEPQKDWIDRSWWSIDEEKLNKGEYIIANFPRPFKQQEYDVKPVIKYIYDQEINIEDICIL